MFLFRSKAEEKLQREYLNNLLKQLENDSKNNSKKDLNTIAHNKPRNSNQYLNFPTSTSIVNKLCEFKRSHRSKSEAFLSINSILSPNNKNSHNINLLTSINKSQHSKSPSINFKNNVLNFNKLNINASNKSNKKSINNLGDLIT